MSSTTRAKPDLPHDVEDGGILYEARYEAATADADAFDTWLRDRIADVLQSPGFLSAEILEETTPAAGAITRTVQYRVRDAAACRAFLDGPSATLEVLGSFGELTTLTRRVLGSREQFQHGAVSTENCLNCGEVLRGQHCMHCGQRARVRVLSLWSLLRDVLGDMLEWDARIWRTLRPLAFRPGLLTQEFLRGRRTHYTPPFRMYLILSVAFFLLASLGEGVAVRFDEQGQGIRLEIDDGAADAAKASAPAIEGTEQRDELAEKIARKLPQPEREKALKELHDEIGRMNDEEFAKFRSAAADPCGEDTLHVEGGEMLKAWEPRLREACRKIVADSQGFGHALYQNVPRTMFVFLPLVALLMQLLYAGSGRFYVEHLLFFVHYHAYFFLGGLMLVLLGLADAVFAGTALAGPLATATNVLATAFVVWSPLYLYLAMRRVYGQGRFLTFVKYTLLVTGYLLGMVMTGLGLLAYTALSL